MSFRTAADFAESRARQRASSFDFLRLMVWVAAAAVPWMGIALIASHLGR
ncbi:MAG: hypothetical protein KGI46_04055 [Alphaproteobacteria bacterium]|nr:hypothetical protein [Alphaproteobacteria bacterium]